VSACLALFRLAIDRKLEIRETQVRIEADGPWFAFDGAGFSAPPYGMDPVVLAAAGGMTVERLAKWIVLNETLTACLVGGRPVKASCRSKPWRSVPNRRLAPSIALPTTEVSRRIEPCYRRH